MLKHQNEKRRVSLSANPAFLLSILERDTRFELATSTLARLHSTTELVPLRERLLYIF